MWASRREPILFVNQDDIANYDKYTEFITQTIQVFGNLYDEYSGRNNTEDVYMTYSIL